MTPPTGWSLCATPRRATSSWAATTICWTAAINVTGFPPRQWGWSSLTMSNTQAALDLPASGAYTVGMWMREDGLRVDRLLLVTDTNYIPTGIGPAESIIQVITNTVAPGLTSHVIQYTYDDLYRLTEALYTGDITATYSYAYDPVGNMTAYTETAGTQTTRVTRYFDNANRLQAAFDYDQGTTSYLYDNNGNLTLIMPAGGGDWLHYGYDQRNLMITHTLSVSGTNPQLQADFTYDGAGNRVQQVDYTGMTPITTTYANDILGLTQVLAADDGAEQVYNLFGLDLIGQDDGANVRYLLADGLGSVRTEMVGGNVVAITIYDSYGNHLTQTGASGTTYGYTGEQHDNATGLLYLRARYYNPALRSFMGRDPWSGDGGRPQSMNGWSYVDNNPTIFSDPTGKTPFNAEYCKTKNAFYEYRDCVLDEYGLDWDPDIEIARFEYQGEPGCWYGPVPYRTSGYLEGTSSSISVIGGWTGGNEIVYDFATMERQSFRFDGIVGQTLVGGGIVQSIGEINGFRSWRTLETDYSGWFKSRFVGVPIQIFGIPGTDIGVGLSGGKAWFEGMPDFSIDGSSWYFGVGAGIGLP